MAQGSLWPPVLIDERSTGLELALIVGGPILTGVLAGLALGASEVLWLVANVVAIAGGYAAGMEHAGAVEGFYRGLIGGLLFGTSVLITNGVVDVAPKAELLEPTVWLIAVTAAFGSALGALGGRWRARYEARR